jgi:hypothetical protein
MINRFSIVVSTNAHELFWIGSYLGEERNKIFGQNGLSTAPGRGLNRAMLGGSVWGEVGQSPKGYRKCD